MAEKQSVLVDIIDGAIAGAVATWIMGKVTTLLYERESTIARSREDSARHGQTAYGVAADKVAKFLGHSLSDDERQRQGEAIHWALGIGAGALYGVLRPRVAASSAAAGLAFGGVFWLVMDETATPLLGLTPGPKAFPWQTHARGLAGHLVYGTVANAALARLEHGA
jgi:hypothetical protein